ncbi:MAG: SDR family oxidoreductase [Candidatus Omnitrophica bacterium]|nr:SDR family oxidoreductase [Candidatus Omnitrophota bacterium]
MSQDGKALKGEWALILGASSGFGAECSRELARAGVNIIGIHLDRKTTQPAVEATVADVKGAGVEALFINMNAADETRRAEALEEIARRLGTHKTIRVLLHSLAFGTLKRFVEDDPREQVTKAQMEMTVDVMAHSLVYWVQDLVSRKLMGPGGRVFAMTSSGGTRVWPTYGAVSAAKACLESHVRQLALELAPKGITANCIRAGVTDTPALRKIPGHDKMIEAAKERNPGGRLTTPRDVAKALAAFCVNGTDWMTGNVIGVDGGEDIVG